MRLTTLKVGFCRIYKSLQQLLLSLQVLPVLVRNSRIQDEVFPGVEGLGMRGLFRIFPRLGIPDFRFWGSSGQIHNQGGGGLNLELDLTPASSGTWFPAPSSLSAPFPLLSWSKTCDRI